MKKFVGKLLLAALVSITIYGCSNKFWDPTQVGRFSAVPVEHVILESLGVSEEAASEYANAEPPTPEDAINVLGDYKLNPGDILRVTVYELLTEGEYYIGDFQVTESGQIFVPEVGPIDVLGLTERELEGVIKDILSPDILRKPAVTVQIGQSERRTFSIYGQGLISDRGGRYQLPRYDFRLKEAIALAGGVSEFNASYIYVTRYLSPAEITQMQENQARESDTKNDDVIRVEPVSQNSKGQVDENELVEMIAPSDRADDFGVVSFSDTSAAQNTVSAADSGEKVEWIFKDGKWVQVEDAEQAEDKAAETAEKAPQKSEQATQGVAQAEPEDEENIFEKIELKDVVPAAFEDEVEDTETYSRVIKVPFDKLNAGDPRYNIIIKPGDVINVPVDSIGECVVMGNVNYQGYVPMTGRPMTLMQAVAAAGGLGPLASPKNVEVRRRVGEDREEIVQVNLKKISEGIQPDFYIKQDDTINVGTDATAYWKAVLRNSFRATYGFGLIYDRNFSEEYYTGRNISDW
ncbi:polysaccharide export protein Wza [Limihaloglobus sulfuriphilus]|uniref:Polysaccharide export protein Wza n=1 Tax=Limihaloglobus sulfuriphilus TaxID=1851148 RepID=A0A1Q2MHA8_9BACT|nr:polysaccharide biosynthesis/export family protein [Limihaloglobus sulfuriphilus]AQQ71918.1 polysaccharide export protein Wza [Limihaloglobus sulfuriphilus]